MCNVNRYCHFTENFRKLLAPMAVESRPISTTQPYRKHTVEKRFGFGGWMTLGWMIFCGDGLSGVEADFGMRFRADPESPSDKLR
jgi:hypothetical protein